MGSENLSRTPLYSMHVEHSARMVPFAGYEMPVQYQLGVKKEHLHCRSQAGLFDISHMGQLLLKGESTARSLESLLPSDIQSLSVNAQRYSVLTNEEGGVLDDLMITNTGDDFFIVVNAACKDKDIEYMQKHLEPTNQITVLHDHALLALQGPKAAEVLQRFCPEAIELSFMQGRAFSINGIDCFINRCGYTGEDGFEISVHKKEVEEIAGRILVESEVEWIGLAARDSLRLEAGYCLYGHDLTESITPVEAGLNWVISKQRLTDEENPFPGREIILQQIEKGIERLRVGLLSMGRVPLREGMIVLDSHDENVGVISSGGFSPSLEKPIAMAYVNIANTKLGTKLKVDIRGRIQELEVVKLPFIQYNYAR